MRKHFHMEIRRGDAADCAVAMVWSTAGNVKTLLHPSGARPALPTVIAIGPARRVVCSESGATRRTGDAVLGSGAFRYCGGRSGFGRGLTVSVLAGATAACLVTGRAASSAGACAAAGLASFSSGLPGSGMVGACWLRQQSALSAWLAPCWLRSLARQPLTGFGSGWSLAGFDSIRSLAGIAGG